MNCQNNKDIKYLKEKKNEDVKDSKCETDGE
jgi:hypothetical protein